MKKIKQRKKYAVLLVCVLIVLITIVVSFLFFQMDETQARKIADSNVPSDAEYFGVDIYDDELIKRYDYTYIVGSDYFKFSVNGWGGIFDERKESTADPKGEKTLATIIDDKDKDTMENAKISKEEAESIVLKNSRPHSTIQGNGFKVSSGYAYYDFVVKSSDGMYRVMIDSENGEVLWNEKI